MTTIPIIELDNYQYILPPERIAQFPLEQRDQSKLLYFNKTSNDIQHHIFTELPEILPLESILIRNTTKVVPVRIFLQKETGGTVELFLVNPHLRMNDIGESTIECMLRGKNMKPGDILKGIYGENETQLVLQAEILEKSSSIQTILLSWSQKEKSFSEIIWSIGSMPLPPYMKRKTIKEDIERYQTVYAEQEGSVAAPTAGLHFTAEVLENIKKKEIPIVDLMLHVGMGTFKPIETVTIDSHQMHAESLEVTIESIQNIVEFLFTNKKIICVGTTSVRTIESLYWFGVRLYFSDRNCQENSNFYIDQWDPYRITHEHNCLPSPFIAMKTILEWMKKYSLNSIIGETALIIIPGYEWKIVEGMITNFHQPGSTLMLLVASFMGDGWKKVYETALKDSYRFLSYGDSSLLLR